MIYKILIVICLVLLWFLIGGFAYLRTRSGKGKWLYHDILGWHQPDGRQDFDGCSVTSRCKYCGKEIMQDSQGNWF